MSHQRKGCLLLGALASGALAIAAMGSSPEANATCASFSGLNSGGGCETTDLGDTAVAIGDNTRTYASGGFNTAIAVGSGTERNQTSAVAVGERNTAISVGSPGPNPDAGGNTIATQTFAGGTPDSSGNTAIAIGDGSAAFAFPDDNNTALTVGDGSTSWAIGDNQIATAIGDNTANTNNGITP